MANWGEIFTVNVFGKLQGVGKEKWKSLSHFQLFVTPWTVVHQAPLSMGFSRQEYCSGSPCPAPANPPNPGSNPGLPHLADSSPSEPPGKPSRSGWYALNCVFFFFFFPWHILRAVPRDNPSGTSLNKLFSFTWRWPARCLPPVRRGCQACCREANTVTGHRGDPRNSWLALCFLITTYHFQ